MTDPKEPDPPSGPQEGRCGAITGRDEHGNPTRWCAKHPRRGQVRCRLHGASAPQALAAAQRRRQEAVVAQAVASLGLRRDITADEALLEELQWTAGHVAWLRDQVRAVDAESLVWGRTSEVSKEATEFPGVDTTREAAPNVWLTLYQKERQHLIVVATAMLKAGVDERRVKLAEQQGALVAGVIRAILGDLNLTPAQQQAAPAVAARHLRALGG